VDYLCGTAGNYDKGKGLITISCFALLKYKKEELKIGIENFFYYFDIKVPPMLTKKYASVFIIALFSILASCHKGNDTGEEVLLSNELREKEGIRFILTWSVFDSSAAKDYAQLDLKLFKGIGLSKSSTPIALEATPDNFINYSVLTNSLIDDGDYTLTIEFNTVSKNGLFDLSVIGYTATTTSKRFTLSNNSFTPANANTKNDFLKIRKTGSKYTFTPI
jgi:hypothetical protein